MLQILDIKKENVITTIAIGKLHQKDIEKVHPIIHTILDKGLKIRWYFEMQDFEGWNINGFWEDLKIDAAHEKEYEKIAIVGKEQWHDWVARFMKPFTNAEIKYFDIKKKSNAQKWIEI